MSGEKKEREKRMRAPNGPFCMFSRAVGLESTWFPQALEEFILMAQGFVWGGNGQLPRIGWGCS